LTPGFFSSWLEVEAEPRIRVEILRFPDEVAKAVE
jgi:hypothetical protein